MNGPFIPKNVVDSKQVDKPWNLWDKGRKWSRIDPNQGWRHMLKKTKHV